MTTSLQERMWAWVIDAFGLAVAENKRERNFRFLEEAGELVQAAGMSQEEALDVIKYVYARPAGELRQEVGGAITTLSALCSAHKLDMNEAFAAELARIIEKIDIIRHKNINKELKGY